MNMTIADVIETHRAAIGAKQMHVDLAPGATPKAVSADLTKLRDRLNAYGAFREEERLQARLDRQSELIDRLEVLARAGDLATIIELTEGTVDVDLEPDLMRMVAGRHARGEMLPRGVEGVIVDLKN